MKLSTITVHLLLVVAPLSTGCRSYNDKVGGVLATYQAGNFEAAAETLSSAKFAEERKSRRDGLLYRLEAGKALLDAGRYEDSSAMFDRAGELITEFDYSADYSVSEEFLTLVSDETTRTYRGTSYDRIQMEVYETLNYLARNDLEEALVHTRRAFTRQAEAVVRNGEEIAAETERAESEGVKSKQVLGDAGYLQMQARLETLVNPAYADYVNPCASWLSAVLLREDGDTPNAIVDMRKVIGMVPDNRYLRPLLEEFEAGQAPAQDRVYVLFEGGMAPLREEFRLSLFTFQQGISTFAIPELVPIPDSIRSLRVESASAGIQLETEHLADIDSIVATDFSSRLPGIVLRTVVSLVAKEIATHQADKRGGDLGFLLANLWKVATAKADLRTWRTMGSRFQLAVLQAPRDGVLRLSLIDRNGGRHIPTEIQIPRARTTLIYVRGPSLTALGAHVMPIGDAQPRVTAPLNEPTLDEPEPETPDA